MEYKYYDSISTLYRIAGNQAEYAQKTENGRWHKSAYTVVAIRNEHNPHWLQEGYLVRDPLSAATARVVALESAGAMLCWESQPAKEVRLLKWGEMGGLTLLEREEYRPVI